MRVQDRNRNKFMPHQALLSIHYEMLSTFNEGSLLDIGNVRPDAFSVMLVCSKSSSLETEAIFSGQW